MNYTTAVFLINDKVRMISALYEKEETGGKKQYFKTLDTTIAKDDILVVPSGTRHGYTTVKVVETDVDFDIEMEDVVKWVVDRIDRVAYEQLVKDEAEAVRVIQTAEKAKKREELKATIMAVASGPLASLPIFGASPKE